MKKVFQLDEKYFKESKTNLKTSRVLFLGTKDLHEDGKPKENSLARPLLWA